MKRVGFIDGRRIAGFTLSGASALDGMKLTISDLTTPASGYTRGLYINYTASGAKTGSAESNALAVDLTVAANIAGYAYGLVLYTAISGSRTIGLLAALSIYCDAKPSGGTLVHYRALDIGMDATNLATRHAFMRLYVAAGTIRECMHLVGQATDFLRFDASNSMGCSASSTGGTVTHKVHCDVGGAVAYLHLFDS